jgi:hypothetical protein
MALDKNEGSAPPTSDTEPELSRPAGPTALLISPAREPGQCPRYVSGSRDPVHHISLYFDQLTDWLRARGDGDVAGEIECVRGELLEHDHHQHLDMTELEGERRALEDDAARLEHRRWRG